jgi:hypothetical protein
LEAVSTDAKPKVIEEHYGRRHFASSSPIGVHLVAEWGQGVRMCSVAGLLTPNQARKLAKQLEKAAEEAEQ